MLSGSRTAWLVKAAAGGNRQGGVRVPDEDLSGRRRERMDEPEGSRGFAAKCVCAMARCSPWKRVRARLAEAIGDAGPRPSASRSGPSLRRSAKGQGDDEQPDQESILNPGDVARPGTPGTGEAICPGCSGRGRVRDGPCATCGGTGKVIAGIGGA